MRIRIPVNRTTIVKVRVPLRAPAPRARPPAGRRARENGDPPLSPPLSPSPHLLALQPTPLQPTALATRPTPKPPSPVAEDLHEKIAARVKEDRMNWIKKEEEEFQRYRNRLKTSCGGYAPASAHVEPRRAGRSRSGVAS